MQIVELPGQVDEEHPSGKDDAALEPSTRREVPMGDNIDAEQHGRRRESEADNTHGVAGGRHSPADCVVGDLSATFPGLFPQDEDDAEHGGEEDELLAKGVEAPVVEVDSRDDISDVPLWDRQLVEQLPVNALVGAELREGAESPCQQAGEY